MSYGSNVNVLDQYRRAAGYVDRILNGEARRLAGAGSDKYELVINLKTARTLGIEIQRAARPRRRGDRVSELPVDPWSSA